MGHIEGADRYQPRIVCLDDMVAKESRVRIIDRFVEITDLEALGFSNTTPAHLGRDSYSPATMVKLYIFGYEKGVRSSRKLEALCTTDIEAMWLLGELKPDFKTIADFRKDNIEAFVALFGEFCRFLDELGLYGKKVVAIDGTKVKASNSKKRHHSRKKLKGLIDYNRKKIEEYFSELESADEAELTEDVASKVAVHQKRIEDYEQLLDELEQSGEDSISLTDPDARMMQTGGFGIGMAYNVQAAVDEENHLVSAFSVSTNSTDYGQLSAMAQKTEEEWGQKEQRGKDADSDENRKEKTHTTFLADKGYYDGDDLARCEELEIDAVVACQDRIARKDRDEGFHAESFIYDKSTDSYTCPANEVLVLHSKPTSKIRKYHNAKACRRCEHKDACVAKNSNKRVMTRRPNSDALDRARDKYAKNSALYKMRQQIIEHVFGTIKRTMDSGYLLLRTRRKAEAEMALIFAGYNLKRACSILGFDEIMSALDGFAQKSARKLLPSSAILLKQLSTATFRAIIGKLGYYEATMSRMLRTA